VRFGGTIVYLKSLSDGSSLAGMQFFEISEDNTRTLNAFLDANLPKPAQENSGE